MGARGALRYGHAVLRAPCRPAEPGSPEAEAILDNLWAVLDSGDGVGLAAPQIGITRRVLVVMIPADRGGPRRLEMVNPEIQETFGPEVEFEEGCLSFPGLYITVTRPRGIVVNYRDRKGTRGSLRDDGLLARVVQHEMDHLDGVLFIDRVDRWRRWRAWPRLGALRLSNLWRRERAD